MADSRGNLDCQCDETYLTGSEFALCAAESTCRLDCQRRGSVSPINLSLSLPRHLHLYISLYIAGFPQENAMAGSVSVLLIARALNVDSFQYFLLVIYSRIYYSRKFNKWCVKGDHSGHLLYFNSIGSPKTQCVSGFGCL